MMPVTPALPAASGARQKAPSLAWPGEEAPVAMAMGG